jgi:hypothetical protein
MAGILRTAGCLKVMALAVLLVFAGFWGEGAFGQATGTITGTVTDPQGAAMVGVTVVVTNTGTGLPRNFATNNSGIYVAPLLPPGTYDIAASHTGFATFERKSIGVQVGQTVRVDIEMPLAGQQSLVTVTAETPLLQTEKTESSQNINETLLTICRPDRGAGSSLHC